jgi:hypothetical protein
MIPQYATERQKLNTGCLKIIVFRVRGLVGDILLTKQECLKKKLLSL